MAFWDRFFGGSSPTNEAPGTVVRVDSSPIPSRSAFGDLSPLDHAKRLDSLVNESTGMGTFNDPNYAARVNPYRNELTYDELRMLGRFNTYASRIVGDLPFDACRAGWKISNLDAEDEEDRLEVYAKVQRSLRSARLFGGAFLMIITEDGDTPSPLKGNFGSILNLLELEKIEVQPETWSGDVRSPRYGKPETFRVTPSTPTGSSVSTVVHWTRLIYFNGAEVDKQTYNSNQSYGDSVLQKAWDALVGVENSDNASNTMLKDLNLDVVTIDDHGAIGASAQSAVFDIRMKALAKSRSMLGTMMIDKDESYERLAMNTTGYKDLRQSKMDTLAAVTGMPLTKLFGQAPGGLNSDGKAQEGIWNDRVQAYQVSDVKPAIKLIYQLIALTMGVNPYKIKITFNPLVQVGRLETAQAEKAEAEADDLRLTQNVLTSNEVRAGRFGPEANGKVSIDEADLELEGPTADEVAQMALEAASQTKQLTGPSNAGE